MSSLETRIARIEAVEALKNLKMQYAKICDEGYDAEAILGLYSSKEEVAWRSGQFGTHEGHAGVRSFFANITGEIDWAIHFMTNSLIDVDEDMLTARGSFYLLQFSTMITPAEQIDDAVIQTAKYEDEFVFEDGQWKFKTIDVQFEQISNLDQGWVRQRYRGR